MMATLQPIVACVQQLIRARPRRNVQPMVAKEKDAARAEFSDRLNQLLDEEQVQKRSRRSLLAREHNVSTEAARKWLTGLAMPDQANLAIMARNRQVNVTWLQSGIGTQTPSTPSSSDLPPHRLALLQAYGSLPPEMRRPIRALIETLAQSLSPSYRAYEADQRRRNAVRDGATPPPPRRAAKRRG